MYDSNITSIIRYLMLRRYIQNAIRDSLEFSLDPKPLSAEVKEGG